MGNKILLLFILFVVWTTPSLLVFEHVPAAVLAVDVGSRFVMAWFTVQQWFLVIIRTTRTVMATVYTIGIVIFVIVTQ